MLRKFVRRQLNIDSPDQIETDENGGNGKPHLSRSIGLMSLIFLCVSNSIGSGVYVLTGIASKNDAGIFNY